MPYTLDRLMALGFDLSSQWSKRIGVQGKDFTVRCSQCQACTINGVPCHETGCTNARHECQGCDTLIGVRDRYCEDCRS